MMPRHIIEVIGCDGSTRVEMDLTPAELVFVQRLAKMITNTSTMSCEPEMAVDGYTFDERPEDGDDDN